MMPSHWLARSQPLSLLFVTTIKFQKMWIELIRFTFFEISNVITSRNIYFNGHFDYDR